MRTPGRLLRTLALGLAAAGATLAVGAPRTAPAQARAPGSTGVATRLPMGQQPPPAPRAAAACTLGPPFALAPAGARAIGVWRDPADGSLHAATTASGAAARSISLWRVDPAAGTTALIETVALPAPGGTPQMAWRTAAGQVLVSWRAGRADRLALSRPGSIHLGAVANHAVVDVPVPRPPHTAEERMLGPLDDPSDSRLAGLMLFVSMRGGGVSSGLSMLSTATAAPSPIATGPNWVLLGGVNLDDTAAVLPDNTLLGAGENGIGAALVRNGTEYEQLGPYGPFNLGRFTVDRRSLASGTGFPRVAMFPTGGELAVWAAQSAGGASPIPLLSQPIDARGHPTGEPVTHPLALAPREGIVVSALRDVQRVGREVFVTVQTLADDAATPRTGTLLRLDARGAAVVPPLQVPLETSRVVPAGPDRVVLWSAESGTAVTARCPSAP